MEQIQLNEIYNNNPLTARGTEAIEQIQLN